MCTELNRGETIRKDTEKWKEPNVLAKISLLLLGKNVAKWKYISECQQAGTHALADKCLEVFSSPTSGVRVMNVSDIFMEQETWNDNICYVYIFMYSCRELSFFSSHFSLQTF